jgi:hypothetical protein
LPVNPNHCNFGVFLWERADPKAHELGEPQHYELTENVEKLEQRIDAYKRGGRFNYIWWAAWNATTNDYTDELGEWWKPKKRAPKSKT